MRISFVLSLLFLGLVYSGCNSDDLTGGGTGTPSDLQALATALGCPTVVAIAIGQSINGSLSNSDCSPPFTGDVSKIDYYGFRITQNMTLTIDQTSSDFDAFVALFDSNGNIIDSDDDSGDGLDARLSLSLNAGLYAIGANSAFSTADFGEYTVSLSN